MLIVGFGIAIADYDTHASQWVENIAVRSNGKILVTLINTPQVWQIDPASHIAELVHVFPHAISALGITEYEHDVFAVVSNTSSRKLRLNANAAN